MIRHPKRFWTLAAGVSALAGYVDAIGFLKLGGLFVSFMSGNSTRLGVGIARDPAVAVAAAGLVAAFVGGVVGGTLVTTAARTRRKPAALACVAVLLAIAAGVDGRWPESATTALLAAAMGAANTTFQRGGEVSVGVTYMTGTLVKLGQRLAAAIRGGSRWAWLPYLALWGGLVAGAGIGATLYPRIGTAGIAAAAGAAALLTVYAALLGPVDPYAADG
ncbi:DUF1275 family protein [Sphingomonas sp. RP10(2022)]|uniref:DUF1275 family protein n=1 Tax=Sphingomonas liriopis TaxID=2949094 RepID=A0A9X2HP53_9SPHN|nr:DUF1275 family protein [Sphingomonas liriopis]MCP3734588.1 DUF1275 family protein [Sphingomonas liriopis]